jgi:type IV pilus assembly protein PilW
MNNRSIIQRGFSLVELMVALAIGSILIAGAVVVYVQGRNSYAVNDSVARLQENARYALSVIEPDVRMSSFWGLNHDPELIAARALQTDPVSAVAPGIPANACGTNFAVDLFNNVEGSDGGYTFGIGRSAACNPGPAGSVAQPNADTLTIRRASTAVVGALNGQVQVWTTRTTGRVFSNGVAPGVGAPVGQINDLIVNTYYISPDSNGRPGIPSLRRKALVGTRTPGVGQPLFQDEEIVSGVEDLQVQFGIDPTGLTGVATQFVDPDAPLAVGTQIVAVRVWVVVRAEAPEVGFRDGRSYTYGSRVNVTPNDGFRRVLFSRTIQIRNSLG